MELNVWQQVKAWCILIISYHNHIISLRSGGFLLFVLWQFTFTTQKIFHFLTEYTSIYRKAVLQNKHLWLHFQRMSLSTLFCIPIACVADVNKPRQASIPTKSMFRAMYSILLIYNRQQNELRHFAQNWAFLCFIYFKRRKYSFPPPSPPCNVVPLF